MTEKRKQAKNLQLKPQIQYGKPYKAGYPPLLDERNKIKGGNNL
jgi:hypothetical protein